MTKMTNAEKEEKERCLAWLAACTWGEEATSWRRQEVEKGGVFLAYGTLCRYDPDGGDGPGIYSLGGQLIEW